MKYRSIAVIVLFSLMATLMLAACGSGGSSPAPAGGRIIAIDAAEFAYTPNKFDAKVGEKLTLKVTNKGTLDHSFVIAGADGTVISRVDVKLGSLASLDFTPSQAGTYQFYCDVPGHKESGMTGTINVQ